MKADPEPLQPFIAEVVRALRHGKGWTQEDLALRLRVQPSEISFLESGRRNSRVETVQRLAAALDVSFFQLIWFAEALQKRVEADKHRD